MAATGPVGSGIDRLGLSGSTLLTGIFGDPVAHSLSPAMHNAAYAALKMDRAYVAFRVAPGGLRTAIRAIPELGLLGVNVTVPHKAAAARLLPRFSAEARALGAVNCIVNRKSGLLGDNTDARGLEMDLRELKIDLRGRPVMVIGAGGGAAAAILALRRLGAGRITIANRTRAHAVKLARRFAARELQVRGLEALVDRELLAGLALVLNATSAGLSARRFPELDYRATARSCFFYDLLYGSTPSAFLRPALQLGRAGADGAGMLLGQGMLAFRLFNRVESPAEAMRLALERALGRA